MFVEFLPFKFGLKESLFLLSAFLFVPYLLLVRFKRYQNLKRIIQKYPDPNVILEDDDIAMEIYSIIFRKEFPLLARTSLEFAQFKTFAIPSVSKLLVSTKEFQNNCTRRAEDTELILSEMIDAYPRIQNEKLRCPFIPEKEIEKQHWRREKAIDRLNELHGNYKISNDDYLYTLFFFVTESIRWVNQWEWRKLDIREINAIFKVWHSIGTKMNIKDIPDTLEGWIEQQRKYESELVMYHPNNWKCAVPTIHHLGSRFPKFMLPILFKIVPCLLKVGECRAFAIDTPSFLMQSLFNAATFLRSMFIRYLCLPRSVFDLRTPFYPNEQGKYVPHYFVYNPIIYKDGYRIEELGPEKFLPKCPVMQKTGF